MYKILKGDILIDNGNGVYDISQNDLYLEDIRLHYLCTIGVIKYDRTQWGIAEFVRNVI